MKNLFIIFIAALSVFSIDVKAQDVFNAARSNDVKALATLKSSGVDFNAPNERGFTPLILAVYSGNLEAAKYLLANGADVNKADKSGNTALMGAIFKGYDTLVKFLIADRKADVNQANFNEATPLIFAVTFGRLEVAKLLIAHKAKTELKDNRGKTAYDHAVIQEHKELIDLLKVK